MAVPDRHQPVPHAARAPGTPRAAHRPRPGCGRGGGAGVAGALSRRPPGRAGPERRAAPRGAGGRRARLRGGPAAPPRPAAGGVAPLRGAGVPGRGGRGDARHVRAVRDQRAAAGPSHAARSRREPAGRAPLARRRRRARPGPPLRGCLGGGRRRRDRGDADPRRPLRDAPGAGLVRGPGRDPGVPRPGAADLAVAVPACPRERPARLRHLPARPARRAVGRGRPGRAGPARRPDRGGRVLPGRGGLRRVRTADDPRPGR